MQGERASFLQATSPSKGVTRRIRGEGGESQSTHPTELVAFKRQQKTSNLGSCPNSAFKAQVSLASTLQGLAPHQQVAPSPAFLLQASSLGGGNFIRPRPLPQAFKAKSFEPPPTWPPPRFFPAGQRGGRSSREPQAAGRPQRTLVALLAAYCPRSCRRTKPHQIATNPCSLAVGMYSRFFSFFFFLKLKESTIVLGSEQAGLQGDPTDSGLSLPQCPPFHDFCGSQSTAKKIYYCLLFFFSCKGLFGVFKDVTSKE